MLAAADDIKESYFLLGVGLGEGDTGRGGSPAFPRSRQNLERKFIRRLFLFGDSPGRSGVKLEGVTSGTWGDISGTEDCTSDLHLQKLTLTLSGYLQGSYTGQIQGSDQNVAQWRVNALHVEELGVESQHFQTEKEKQALFVVKLYRILRMGE